MDLDTLKRIPKTEIHLHLEGMATSVCIWKLMQKHSLEIEGVSSREDLDERFKVDSLAEFIDLFINVIQCSFKEPEDFQFLIEDVREYLISNSIIYAEIFVAPTTFLKNGFDFEEIMSVLEREAAKLQKEEGIEIKYIIDVSRGFGLENAMNNLNLTLKHKNDRVIGIGLGGAEKMGAARDFKAVFDKAREAGLKVVAHGGEDCDYDSVVDAVNLLGVSRIGHGISAMNDEETMDMLRDKKIVMEVCPTSNLFTKGFVDKLEDHPVRLFYDRGLFVTINSDDPSLFGSTISEEYDLLLKEKVFTKEEIVELMINNVKATFLTDERKAVMEKLILDSVKKEGFL